MHERKEKVPEDDIWQMWKTNFFTQKNNRKSNEKEEGGLILRPVHLVLFVSLALGLK